jgi:polysaccharide biosynthesis/export protein
MKTVAQRTAVYALLVPGLLLTVDPIRAQRDAASAPSGAVVEEYVLGVEDKLAISVWKEPDLLRSVTVRPDGKITFPLIGDVQAAGRTARGLTDDIAKALAKYIKEPVVTVIVEEINNYKVFVLGEVETQGALTLHRKTRFLEAIAMAGGLTTYADKGNVTLLRYDEGKESRTRIDYRKVVSGEKPEFNVWLVPGDTIIVN